MVSNEASGIYSRLRDLLGPYLAAYITCAAVNTRYEPDIDAETWNEYLELREGGAGASFADGETDVNTAILSGMEQKERWAVVWGSEYSEEQCRQLDDLYRTMTAQLDANGGVIDKMQEDAARTCARMALNRNRLLNSTNKDDIAVAKSLDDMIRKNLQDCNMRKADILPTQKQRPDGFIDQLRKSTGLGPDMTQNDVLRVIYNWFRKQKYPCTTDAADHTILSIHRTMAKNNDMPEPTDLDPRDSFEPYSAEFAPEPNEQEKETYKFLGLSRKSFKKPLEDDG